MGVGGSGDARCSGVERRLAVHSKSSAGSYVDSVWRRFFSNGDVLYKKAE